MPSSPPTARSSGFRMGQGLLLIASLVMVACAPARVVTRGGEPWGCVEDAQRLARSSGSAPVLGWLSSAPLTRWIEVIDRIGQRSGAFAAGSSVRTRAEQDLVAGLAKVGIEGVDWLDPGRPLHMTWQPPKGGSAPTVARADEDHRHVTLIVPSQGAGKVEDAARKATVGRHPSAPGIVIRLEDKQAWISHLNHYTQLLTMTAAQHRVAAPAARCLHSRRPRALLTAGVAVAELMRQRPGWVDEALSAAREETKGSEKAANFVDDWLAELREMVASTEAIEMTAQVDERRATLGATVRALPESALARRFATAGAMPANPLLRLLPAESYFATASTWESSSDSADTAKYMNMMLELLQVSPEQRTAILADLEALLLLSEPHSAAALHPAQGLALSADALWTSKDGHAQLQAARKFSLGLLVLVLRAGKKEAQAKAMAPAGAAAETDNILALAQSQGWSGLFRELATRSATWPVRLAVSAVQKGDLRCDTLSGRLDWKALGKALPAAGMARTLVGERVGFGLCSTSKMGMFVLHADPLAEATRVAAGKGDGLAGTALYKQALAGRATPQWFALLNPTFLVETARQVFDSLPPWPKGEAIVSSCHFEHSAARCRLDLPLAIADMVAPMLGGPG